MAYRVGRIELDWSSHKDRILCIKYTVRRPLFNMQHDSTDMTVYCTYFCRLELQAVRNWSSCVFGFKVDELRVLQGPLPSDNFYSCYNKKELKTTELMIDPDPRFRLRDLTERGVELNILI